MEKRNNSTTIIKTPSSPRKVELEWWEKPLVWLFGLPFLLFLRGLGDRSLWLVLLAILMIILLALLLRQCNGDNGKQSGIVPIQPVPNPITGPYIPPYQQIPPFDPGKIGFDKDSISQIATDRINILLEKQNDSTALSFQQDFKKLYPKPEYEFVYFDSLTYRLQLKVPEAERTHIMDTLNAQMPDYEFYMFDESVFGTSYIPNDPDIRAGHNWFFKAIHCYEAWDITMGVDSIKVAVVDNGFDLNHPEFKGHYVNPYNVVERNQRLYPPIPLGNQTEPGHGTHVAATAVGLSENGAGVCGIAPKCTLIPVQVGDRHGNMSLTSVLDGILYAIYKGADVVNVSLGISVSRTIQFLPPQQQLNMISGSRKNEQRVWDEVFKIAKHKNVTLVLAAGNENVLSGFDAMKRSKESIIVSAVNGDMRKADFSNYGYYANAPYCFSTVSAPGVDIYSAYPGGRYTDMKGTSMASPIVSGSVALMKSINPNLTTEQIIEILQKTGIPSKDPIGNIIQLDAALKAVQSGNYSK